MIRGVLMLRATFIHIGLVMYLRVMLVEGWTYSYSNETMTWNDTRKWCQTNYTDIVMIHNENVTRYLEQLLPKRSGYYYWIGIKKKDGLWTLVANGQVVKYHPWAKNEPNNIKSTENCVEMYINNYENNGKWNDEGCEKKKLPVCHKAQCPNKQCSDREDCIEQVNNFTCVCKAGLFGPRCETVVKCKPEEISQPDHGSVKCSNPNGNFSYESVCEFSCEEGYELKGSTTARCTATMKWSSKPPTCEPVSCEKLTEPLHGWIECASLYGNHSLNSSCQVFCADGYKMRGTAELWCSSSGTWNAPLPLCAVECYPLLLFGGGLLNCTESHDAYRSTCRVQCPPGHLLMGFAEFTCRADGTWISTFPLMCASYIHFLIILGCFVLSTFCCFLFSCSNCRKSRKAVRSRTHQETVNPAYEAEHTPTEDPLCSA